MADSKKLFIVLLLVSAGHFLIDFMLSIWPVFKTMAHLDLSMAAYIAVVALVIGELMQLPFGKLIDHGYQTRLLISGVILATAAIFFSYVHSYVDFGFLLILTCIGSAAFHPTAASILGSLNTPRKALFLSVFQMAGNFGMGTGQLFFSKAYESSGGQTIVFIIPTLIIAISLIYYRSCLPTFEKPEEMPKIRQIFKFFGDPNLRCLYLIQVANQTVLWSLVFLLPDFLLTRCSVQWVIFGGGHFILLLGATLGCLPMGYLADRFGPTKIILNNLILSTISFYAMLCIPTLSIPLLLAALFMIGMLIGSLPPLVLTLGTTLAPTQRGLISAFLMGLVWIVSETIGIGISGTIADCFVTNGPANALLFIGSSLFIGCFFAYRLFSLQKRVVSYSEESIQ